jgi:pimeloyl-ACP methyl ester carboxylesterase
MRGPPAAAVVEGSTCVATQTPTAGSPTVVLVHGAFADAVSWNGVIERLQAKGIQVTAPANPLRGLSIDSAYVAGVPDEIPRGRGCRRSLARRRGDHERRGGHNVPQEAPDALAHVVLVFGGAT